jgi:RNA polymerase primary sigma factor
MEKKQNMNNRNQMTINEELELVRAIKNGDEEAMKKLSKVRLRFVESIAKRHLDKGLSFDELMTEGNKGLIAAARNFDESRGFKFISYAVWWIRNSMLWAVDQRTNYSF